MRNLALAVCAAAAMLATPALAQNKFVWGLPGIPPVFGTVIGYVAKEQGFWKKYGIDVDLRQFDSGAAASRAVASGDIDASLSPTGLIVNQISNANVNVVAIHGMPNPDWLIGSTEPGKTCKDMAGQPVGVDTPGGARSIALRIMLASCGMKLDDVQQVALSSNVGAAMIAGRLTYGVLHLDDAAPIENAGKKVHNIVVMKNTNPNDHYLLVVARQDKLTANRDSYVKFIAGLIDAGHYLADPKNADKIADIAKPTGRSKEEARAALKAYNDMGFWALDNDGLDRKKLDSVVATQARVGGIQKGKEPVKYERLVDQSVWRDALALTQKK